MKNKIKSLSLLSIATLPIITTTAVACASNNVVEPIEMVNVSEYQSQITPISAPTTKWTQEQAIEKYVADVSSNPMIFKDDMFMNFKNMLETKIKPSVAPLEVTECTFGLSKPTFSTTHSWIHGTDDYIYPTVSFREKCHLKLDSTSTEYYHLTNTIDFEIWYTDVIFCLCEDIYHGGWNIGMFDWNMHDESLWPFIRNINPWSISYSATIAQKKVIFGGESRPDVEINNCSYYSGNIYDAIGLNNLFTSETSTMLEDAITCLILMGSTISSGPDRFKERYFYSNYLKNVTCELDVRLTTQTSANVQVGQTQIRRINGLQAILPVGVVEPNTVTATLTDEIKLYESTVPIRQGNCITFPKGMKFKVNPDTLLLELDTTGELPTLETSYSESYTDRFVAFSYPEHVAEFQFYINGTATNKATVRLIYDNLALWIEAN